MTQDSLLNGNSFGNNSTNHFDNNFGNNSEGSFIAFANQKGFSVTAVVQKMSILTFGAAMTFGLFAFMALLVSNDQVFIDEPSAIPVIQLAFNTPEPTVNKKIIRLKPTPPVIKPQVTSIPTSTKTTGVGIPVDMTAPQLPATKEVYNQGMGTSDAMPVVQVSPQYPMVAARDGREGFVIVEFDINTVGTVINARVLQAEPKRVFDRSAIQAIKGWKYKPKVEQGMPVIQSNQRVRLDFTLDKVQ
ncbi:energy transducer TonB [Shewanella donghaensis]|uniref:energy transducer TonB n=1 Tax=Shewanella donghaensis TaxID=238836 RepID=UPI0011830E24|nr:energy transducer TonB [Shewanella donghaensis]